MSETTESVPVKIQPRWPGLLVRQDLVVYCVARAEILSAELKREQKILAEKEDTMSDEQYETLTISTTALMAQIRVFREITEYARENKLEVSVL